MKRSIVILFYISVALAAQAAYRVTPYTPSASKNYITSITPIAPCDSIIIGNESISSSNNAPVLVEIAYFDGLGRSEQNIKLSVAPHLHDLADYSVYEPMGRVSQQWLPIPKGHNSGSYIPLDQFSEEAIEYYSDGRPFVQNEYEQSLLGREQKRYRSGDQWESHPTQTHYRTNVAQELLWFTVEQDQLVNKGHYPPGRLVVVEQQDEDHTNIYTCKDLEGRTLMQKQASDNYTYWVYDDMGRLRYVLPCLAVDQLISPVSYPKSHSALANYAYIYEYDAYGNCVESKEPGVLPIYMVYDRVHRMILRQDGVQRSSSQPRWTIYKYHALGDLLYRGIVFRSHTRAQLASEIAPFRIVENYYPNSNFSNTNYTCDYFVREVVPDLVNYYSYYGYLSVFPTGLAYESIDGFGSLYHPTPYGQLTGQRVYDIADRVEYVSSAFYYNRAGDKIQQRETNWVGGYDYTYTSWSVSHQPLVQKQRHTADTLYRSSMMHAVDNQYEYIYDHGDRLTSLTLNGATLYRYRYDVLGRLSSKLIYNGLDSTLYQHNIQGWVTQIKSPFFEENIYYDQSIGGSTPCFNGNISAVKWRNSIDNQWRGYRYSYDDQSRLLQANWSSGIHLDQTPGLFSSSYAYDKMGRLQSLTREGVISRDMEVNEYGTIDQLQFVYGVGHRLKRINDAAPMTWEGAADYKDRNTPLHPIVSEFSYDSNGNLSKDQDREIVSQSYNSLNLPQRIQFKNNDVINYRYDALGRKYRMEYIPDRARMVCIDYSGAYIYRDYKQARQLIPGGYIQRVVRPASYHFYQRDHQGNNRIRVSKSRIGPRYLSDNRDYYPFGVPFNDHASSDNMVDFTFSNKESQPYRGLHNLDFAARQYYPAAAIFTSPDPLASKYPSVSPYSYCASNPVNIIDPTGMDWYRNNSTSYYTWYQGNIEREGYTHVGGKGSFLGEFESMIDGVLTSPRGFNTSSLYSEGFTFDIAPKAKDGWDFLNEFIGGYGPEFSVFLSDHPYTQTMQTDDDVIDAQQKIKKGPTDIPGQITNKEGKWTEWDVLTTRSLARQFIGSYRYDGFTSRDGKSLHNLISDSKSRYSLFYHLYPSELNRSRSQQRIMGNTYQFYIWQTTKDK